jgi:hypothetical protein
MTTLKLGGTMRTVQIQNIHNDLREAYLGTYEDDFDRDWTNNLPDVGELSRDDYVNMHIDGRIREHTAKERLDVYLTWNGILGWTGRIWDISQGEFES